MLLREHNNIWGIPLEDIKKQGRKYKLYSTLIYIFNFLLIVFSGVYMFKNGSSFSTCVFATIFIALLSFMFLNLMINPVKWRAYLFFKKYRNYKIVEVSLLLKPEDMKNMLYCSNYKRKKDNGTISDYKELMLSACCEDSIFSKRLGNLLYKFNIEEDNGTTEVKAYMIAKRKNYYLIGFEMVD